MEQGSKVHVDGSVVDAQVERVLNHLHLQSFLVRRRGEGQGTIGGKEQFLPYGQGC
jgi:hypothetical protein